MNIILIDKTIEDLENGDTTFATCADLASLYIVRDHYRAQKANAVETELKDIPPSYKKYCDIKRRYQLGDTSHELVLASMRNVCREIDEFISTLHSTTESQDERELLIEMIDNVSKKVH
jgi:hypothetical protein